MDVSKVYNTNDDNNSNWTNSGSSSSNSTTATSVPNTEHLHVQALLFQMFYICTGTLRKCTGLAPDHCS